MISRMAFCSAQAAVTFPSASGRCREVSEPFRVSLDDGEDLLPESIDQHLGKVGADTLDHAGAEILLDPLQGARAARL